MPLSRGGSKIVVGSTLLLLLILIKQSKPIRVAKQSWTRILALLGTKFKMNLGSLESITFLSYYSHIPKYSINYNQ